MALRMTESEYTTFLNKGRTLNTKSPKYRNIKKIVNGVICDSTKEANRYLELLTWQHSGRITELEAHRPFDIKVNGRHICKYISDLTYKQDGRLVVEDTKSKITRKLPVYRLKKKLMLACLGIEIQEV